ncbi:beta propeller repeat protein [Calidifontibacter terrae]
MNWLRPRGDDTPEPAAEHDPVADFFAAHRSELQTEEADELTWARIARGARAGRAPRSGRTWVGSVGACAAVLIAVFAVWTWRQQPIDSGSVRAGQMLSQGPEVPASGDGGGNSGVATAQRPGPVPTGFVPWSLSNAGRGTVYALGSATCDGSTCPTLLRSADDGGTWTAVQTFHGTDVSSLVGTDVPAVQPDRAVSEVRFADQQVGYVYGGDLWVTSDRGASFEIANHPGETVLDLEIWAERVYLLTADNCVQGACAGPLYLSSASATSPSGFTQVVTTRLTRPIEDASLTVSGSRAAGNDIVVVQTQGQNRVTQAPYRLSDGKLVTMTGPAQRCGENPIAAMTISSDSANRLIGLCRKDPAVPTYTVITSVDAGRSWSAVAGGSVTLPDVGRLSIAATDATHIAVSAGGPRGSSYPTGSQAERALQVSSDGGRSFTVPTLSSAPPASGFDWTASPGAGWFYAVSHTTGGFWASQNFGRTWKVISPSS